MVSKILDILAVLEDEESKLALIQTMLADTFYSEMTGDVVAVAIDVALADTSPLEALGILAEVEAQFI